MAINVPQSVFDKYFEVIDSTFTIFGVTCQLVFIETVEEISTSFDNFPTHNSVNAHRRGVGNRGFEREDKVFKEVEKTEDILLKVYWDARSWVKTGSDIVVPDGATQTIGKMDDLPKVLRSKELIVHKDITDLGVQRFQMTGDWMPAGLKQNKYFACFWERV